MGPRGVVQVKHEALNTQGCTSDADKDKCLLNIDREVYGASFPDGTQYRPTDPRPCAEIQVRHLPVSCASTAFAAKTAPLPCAPTDFVAKNSVFASRRGQGDQRVDP